MISDLQERIDTRWWTTSARPYPSAIDYFQSTGSADLATAPEAIA